MQEFIQPYFDKLDLTTIIRESLDQVISLLIPIFTLFI